MQWNSHMTNKNSFACMSRIIQCLNQSLSLILNYTTNCIYWNATQNLTNFCNCYPYAITPVCMAVKSHLRNQRPVVIAASTNDALSGAAKNIGTLRNYKNFYFVPLYQDDCLAKPFSLIADFKKIPQTILEALDGRQTQPVYITKP